jgi:hypothetical protein
MYRYLNWVFKFCIICILVALGNCKRVSLGIKRIVGDKILVGVESSCVLNRVLNHKKTKFKSKRPSALISK